MKRSLLRPGLLALALTGLGLPGAVTTSGTAAPAAAPVPPVELVVAPVVDVNRYDGWVYGDLGPRLAATTAPVELWSTRTSYADPIVTELRSPGGSTTLPAGTLKDFRGLPRFYRMTLRNKAGDIVYNKVRRYCMNGDSQRMRPDAPARSPYPWGCPWHPFTKGSVQGIQEGWSVSLTGEQAMRLKTGRYSARVAIAERYAELFGLSDAQRVTTYTLRVRNGGDESFRKPVAPRSPIARPNARRPKGASGGVVAGPTPDLQSLPAFGMSIAPGGNFLRFSATVWNAGDSPLVVDGFRRPGEDVMDAYQYFFDADGNQTGYAHVGEMEWHAANHQHWHFHDFARYRLLRASDQSAVVRSKKESFCLANTDAVDYTVPGAEWKPENTDLSSACGGRDTLSLREVLSQGSGDTYMQFRAGQSFNLKGVPNGWYYVAVEANPTGHLTETDTTNNVALRKIHIGGRPDHRTVRMSQVGIVDDSSF
ncbi:lysyl oxidase family protein [Nocardioides guangzhouensis]|uniref:lysyl oxidase family protein n=1 Tax=Nocardioides guangzhouensis TaxID=2497878 RepID=UPI001FEB0507|nr:lysyl oxidase family protein [Nocardioides guangzhouensis]